MMKKALIVVMLSVFVFTFVGTIMTTNADAKGRVNCDKLPCIGEVFPDGSKYICCEYEIIRNKCYIDESECSWVPPDPE